MRDEDLVRKLADYLLLNASSVSSSGLYNGKAGVALALFEAARFLHDDYIEGQAFILFQEALLSKTNDVSFEKGLLGIGYVLLHLIDRKYLEADFCEIFDRQCELILSFLESIGVNQPNRMKNSLKSVYFLHDLQKMGYQDRRIFQIIEQLMRGSEHYLTTQFLDWTKVGYSTDKVKVLRTFEDYLSVVQYSSCLISPSVVACYADTYRIGRIMSSLRIGTLLERLSIGESYRDIISANKQFSEKEQIRTLKEKINLAVLIDDYEFLPMTEGYKELETWLLRLIPPPIFIHSYEGGISRFLIWFVDKNTNLLR